VPWIACAFRHRERNTYGTNLDFDIVIERSREAINAFEMFHQEVRSFFTRGIPDPPPADAK